MSLPVLKCFLIVCLFSQTIFAKEKFMKQIRTYMSYTYPLDPVRIISIPDMDLSYALAGTLVQWDKDKQLSSAVAGSWEPVSKSVYAFKIRKGLKWSDNNPVTALDIKKSFERALKDHPEDLRSLISLVKTINTASNDTLEFHLTIGATEGNLLGKLTEPNFGVLKINSDGKIDLSVTTGAFFVSKNTQDELILKKNPNWFMTSNETPDEIVIRKPSDIIDLQTVLFENEWPNLVETNSLLSKSLMGKYKENGFEVWSRPLDKIFLLHLSKSFVNKNGAELLRYLRKNISRQDLVKGLSGLSLTDQVFPVGYQLHDDKMAEIGPDAKLPERFKKEPLRILLLSKRVNKMLQDNIRKVLTVATGVEPQFTSTTLDKLGERRRIGDYDIYVGSFGLADPDPEGVMSYYFEGATPVVQSGNEKFVQKLDAARKENDLSKRLQLMRALMTEATMKGHILPLFHLSTVGIGRKDLDFKAIPTSDESVTLSKIRFKKRD